MAEIEREKGGEALIQEAKNCLERGLIGSPKYLRARVQTAISLLDKANRAGEGGRA